MPSSEIHVDHRVQDAGHRHADDRTASRPSRVPRLRHLAVALLWIVACPDGAREQAGQGAETPALAASADVRAQLESLGYVVSSPVDAREVHLEGVTYLDSSAASPGYNLFNSRHASRAQLIDLGGRAVHSWQSDVVGRTAKRYREMLPDQPLEILRGWNHVELLADGDLLVIGTHHMLSRLDWTSGVVWKRDIAAHHDLDIDERGNIYVLADGLRSEEANGESVAFQDDYIVVLDPDGVTLRRISLFDAFSAPRWRAPMQKRLRWVAEQRDRTLALWNRSEPTPSERVYRDLYRSAAAGDFETDADVKNLLFHSRPEDVFHSNSIQLLDANPGLWRKGDLLVSILMFNMLAVIDHESGRVIWTWTNESVEHTHHASATEDGRILFFDNGISRRSSRIVEVDPETREISWEYVAEPPHDFFSRARGGAQGLGNGNVLVTESDAGRVFEVTRAGRVVWSFHAPILAPDGADRDGPKRAAIYRMTRIPEIRVDAILARRGAEAPKRAR